MSSPPTLASAAELALPPVPFYVDFEIVLALSTLIIIAARLKHPMDGEGEESLICTLRLS